MSDTADQREPYEQRAYQNMRQRRIDKIRQVAGRIEEYAGYILRDLEHGRPLQHYAGGLLDDAQDLVTAFAEIEAMHEVKEVFDAAKKASQ